MTPEDRSLFASLADQLIPAGAEMPSASEAEVATAGVDFVLSVQPDLGAPLDEVLALVRGGASVESLAPDLFAAFGEIVAGAYYLNPKVAALVGYQGRRAVPMVDDLDDALLAPVLSRGPIYRPDPR